MLGKIVFSNGKHTLFNGVIVFFLLYTLAFVVANMKHYFWSTSHTNKRIHKRKKKNTNVSFIFGQNKTEGFFYSALFYYFLSFFPFTHVLSCIHTFTTLLSNFDCLALPLHILPQSNGTSLATNLVYFCFEVFCFNIISIKYSQGF